MTRGAEYTGHGKGPWFMAQTETWPSVALLSSAGNEHRGVSGPLLLGTGLQQTVSTSGLVGGAASRLQ